MKQIRLLTLVILAGLTAMASGRTEDLYTFELNGEPFEPYLRSLNGTPETPDSGDIFSVYRIPMVLGEPGHYQLETEAREPSKESLIYRVNDGKRVLLGVHLKAVYSDDPKPTASILTTLSEGELAQVAGIYFERWDDVIRAKLESLKLNRTFLSLEDDVLDSGKLADLPKGVAYLGFNTTSGQTRWDFESLRKQTDLKMIELDQLGPQRFDVTELAGNTELRFLKSGGIGLENVKKLGEFTELRDLDLSWDDTLQSVGFVSKLSRLKRLAIRSTQVSDLTPIESLSELQEVDANEAPVETLPQVKLPSLRKLEVMSSQLTVRNVGAFAKLNPETEIWHDWGEALARALDGVTRIHVRSGGTCHRDPVREKSLFEVTEAAEIAKLVDLIEMEDEPGGGHCMCCGNPSLEFFKGDEMVATLGFHHGRTLRWPGGWPRDGAITPASAKHLCLFLDRHGVKGPLEEFEEGRRQEDALKRRYSRYNQLIPAPLLDALRQGAGPDAFAEKLPDDEARGLLCFRLFGCHEDSWNLSAGIDKMLDEKLLPDFSAEFVRKSLLPKAAGDPELLNGLARWIFSYDQRKNYDGKLLGEFLAPLAEYGLAHPRERSRQRTLNALARMNVEASKSVLRQCLAGDIEIRELDEELMEEPGGMVSFSPGQLDIPDKAGLRASAAVALGQLGDESSRAAIEKLAKSAGSEADREACEAALKLLKK